MASLFAVGMRSKEWQNGNDEQIACLPPRRRVPTFVDSSHSILHVVTFNGRSGSPDTLQAIRSCKGCMDSHREPLPLLRWEVALRELDGLDRNGLVMTTWSRKFKVFRQLLHNRE